MRYPWLVIVLAAVAMTGCSASEDNNSDKGDASSPIFEAQETLAVCMQDLGWEVEVLADGRIDSSYPTTQRDAFEADYDECTQLAGLDEPLPPLTQEEAAEYFEALLAAAECLEDLGYSVADPPSRELAIEELQKEIIDLGWDPYDSAKSSEDSMTEAYTECPPPQ